VVSFSAYGDGLRLFNPNDAAAAASVSCDGAAFTRTLAPHGLDDVVDGRDCKATSAAPLLVLETGAFEDGVEWQRLVTLGVTNACPATAQMFMPLNGCRFGSAVAAVVPVEGATYSWSIDGGSILGGAGSERVLIGIDSGTTLRASVAIAKDGCTTTAAGVMVLHDAFVIKTFDPGAGILGQPRTVTWSFANGEPATQVLSGSDLPQPVTLSAGARSYTFTPQTAGDRQIVLQASLAALVGRTRAAGRGGGSASNCGTARASAAYYLDCIRPDASIIAPGSVGPGKPFTARVTLASGSTAAWTVVNGTPATATGESVTITPSGTEPVDLGVTVTANGGCFATSTAHIVVNQACDNPAATLSINRNDCSDAILQAHFSGKPPFRGTWENGQTFLTGDFVLDRPVGASGTYAIAQFQDATCPGSTGSPVNVTVKLAGAVLSAPNGFCSGPSTTAVATFAGAPPFIGTWSDGVAFTTSSKTLQRPVTNGGALSLTFTDGNACTKTSAPLPFIQTGSAALGFNGTPPSCVYGPEPLGLAVNVTGGTPPFKVTWSDGYVQESSSTPILRDVYGQYSPFAITSVRDATCNLTLTNNIVSVAWVQTPNVRVSNVHSAEPTYFCPGAKYYADEDRYYQPAALTWHVTNGTIVSGQGTGSLVFAAGTSGTTTVSCELTRNGCTSTAQFTLPVHGPTPAEVTVDPASIAVGKYATITIKTAADVASYTVTSSSPTDKPIYIGTFAPNTYSWSYTPTAAGSVTLTVRVTGTCGTTADTTAALTVF
jgi:hypothetical protein